MIGNVKSEAEIVGIVTTSAAIAGDIRSSSVLANVDAGKINIIHTDLPDYEGQYVIYPGMLDTVLATTNKTMREDLTFKALAYEERENSYGGYTVIIGTGE